MNWPKAFLYAVIAVCAASILSVFIPIIAIFIGAHEAASAIGDMPSQMASYSYSVEERNQ